MKRPQAIPWPHVVDHENQIVYVHVDNGYPTVTAVPQLVAQVHPGYKPQLITANRLKELLS